MPGRLGRCQHGGDPSTEVLVGREAADLSATADGMAHLVQYSLTDAPELQDHGAIRGEIARRVQSILDNSISRGFFRNRAAIEEMLVGLELVDPGITVVDEWWPDAPPSRHCPPLAAASWPPSVA